MAATLGEPGVCESAAETGPGDRGALPGLDWRGLVVIGAAKLAFHLCTSGLYGLHRDEFYFLAAGRHLAAGYVDQPPLVPLMYRGWASVFGSSSFALHAMAAVLSVPLLCLAALLARELGGRQWAQRATMTVAAVGTVFTTSFHFVSTTTVDIVVTALASWLVLRLLRTGDTRLWVAIGAVAGVGFEAKHTIVIWSAAIALGLLLSPHRRLLRSPWLLAGLSVAAVIAAPNLWWQATHDWASLAFYAALRHRVGTQNLLLFWPMQLGLMTCAGTVLVVAGLRRATTLRRDRESAAWPVAVAFAAVVAFFFVTSGKGYYTAGVYLPVVAAGAVSIETTWVREARTRLIAAVVATGAMVGSLFTPVLPAGAAVRLGLTKANPDLGAMIGWHAIVGQLGQVYRSLPPDERAHSAYLTRDYSEASALAYWQHADHLPPAISPHNAEWWWGWSPAGQATTVIAVGIPPATLRRYFATVTTAGTLQPTHNTIDPEQANLPVSICTGRRLPWPVMWDQLRNYA